MNSHLSRRCPSPQRAALIGLALTVGLAHETNGQLVTVQPPASTTTVSVEADFRGGIVVLRATLAGLEPDLVPVLVRADGTDFSNPGLRVRREGLVVELAGSADQLTSALTEGSRSLWLRAGPDARGGLHRIDLPPVELKTGATAARYQGFDEGLAVYLPAENLIPGFEVWHFGPNSPGTATRPLPTEKGTLPRVYDVYRNQVRVILPFRDTSPQPEVHYFALVNLDRSRSNMIKITRNGDRLTAATVTVRAGRPAPVDLPVAAPSVELMEVAVASQRAQTAGLNPIVVDLTTFDPVSEEDLVAIREAIGGEPTIVRQGVPPGATLRAGDRLYLGIRDPRRVSVRPVAVSLAGEFEDDTNPLEFADLTEFGVPGEPALDPGDELGFVPIGEGDGPSSTDGNPLDEAIINSQLDADLDDEAVSLALGNDPGLSLDPSRTGSDLVQTALVKLLLSAAATQRPEEVPAGPIGRAIAAAVRAHEGRIRTVLTSRGADQAPLVAMFREVASTLNLRLEPQLLDEMADLWMVQHRGLGPEALDRNRNYLIADDAAVWLLASLFRDDRFDPLSDVRVVNVGGGRPVAVIGAVGGRPEEDGARVGLKLGRREGPEDARSDVRNATEPPLPDGPDIARLDVSPSQVKLPEFEGESVKQAHAELRRLGLELVDLTNFYPSDTVVSSQPSGGTWLASGSDVELVVTRKTPKVTGVTLAKAEAFIDEWKLTSKVLDDGPRPTDVVAEQVPAAGDPIQRGGTIRLRLARAVPDVVRQFVFDGGRKLRTDGFRPIQATDLSRWDRIVEQSPRAGTMARVTSTVDLTVRREIPDLQGKSFAEAGPILKDRHIPVQSPRDFSPSESIFVAGQDPPPGTARLYRPEGGEPLRIALTRGRRIPDLREQPMEMAVSWLEDRNLRADYRDGYLGEEIPLKVLEQDRKPGEVVAYNTLVRLKMGPVGVLIPSVEGMTLAQAVAKLRSVDLGAAYNERVFNEDVVVAQDPPPYGPGVPSWLHHKEKVSLDVRVRVPQVTRRNVAAALHLIRGWDLQADLPDRIFEEDWVVEQFPVPGTLVAHGDPVRVIAKVIVPSVLDQRFRDAERTVRNRDLDIRLDVPPNALDVVTRQVPEPQSLLDHGESVYLELQVPVPNVAGMTRDQAVEALQSWDLEASIPNRLAFGMDIVQGQQPQPNQLIPHRARVMLGPIVGSVPRLAGMSIGEARDLLASERYDSRFQDGVIPRDMVTGQDPPPGTPLERGNGVSLDARISVPDLRGMSLAQAADSLNERRIPLGVDAGRSARPDDRVLDQSIRPGTPVIPRTVIALVPGYRVPDLAGMDVNRAGVLLRELDIPSEIDRQRSGERETDNNQLVGRTRIVDQSLRPGQFVPRGTQLGVVVVQYIEALTTVPDLRGDRGTELIGTKLRRSDLNARFLNSPANGPVVSQNPPPGRRVRKGTTVVVEFPPRQQGGGVEVTNTVPGLPARGGGRTSSGTLTPGNTGIPLPQLPSVDDVKQGVGRFTEGIRPPF